MFISFNLNFKNISRFLMFVMAATVLAPSPVFRLAGMNLKSVTITDAPQNGVHMVTVERRIRPFNGSYKTTLRNSSGLSICDTPLPEQSPRRYRATDGDTITQTLTWWMGTENDLLRCKRNGFDQPDEYTLLTCHRWHLGNFETVVAQRCVESNVFKVLPKE